MRLYRLDSRKLCLYKIYTFFQGIRDLFRVLYYFNDWVDDPITFDLFDALFNFGYRQKIPEDGI